MKKTTALVLATAALAMHGAQAETSVGFSLAADRLSNDTPDWHDTTVQILRQYGPRRTAALALTQTERFGLRDNQISATAALPFGKAVVATVDGNVSNTHRVLAKHAYGATLQVEFAPAWLIHGGTRTTRYDAERVNQGLLMLEHYFSSFSWAAGWRPARAFDTSAHSGELRGSYYYGDRNSVGLILAGGKEAASIGGNVSLTSMRSAVMAGRHWLTRDWALNYSIGHTRQGDFYTRNGLSLGLQYAF